MIAAWFKSLERRYGLDLRVLALLRMSLALVILGDRLGRWGELSGAMGWQIGGGAIATFAALLLLIGYHTRWATIISWVMLVLLYSPQTVSATDNMVRMLLFWAMFLPLGSCYSVDQALNTSPQPQPQRILTGATLGLIIQLCWTVAVFIKTASFAGGLLSCVIGLAFVPPSIWQRWTTRAYTPKQLGLNIYYDADCGFCKKVVHLLRTFLVLPCRVPLRTAQSDPVIQTAMETHNSWVIVDWQGQHHYKWQGIAYVVSLSPILWPLARVLRWSPLMALGTRIYETIANNRRFAGNFTKPFKFQSFTVHSPGVLDLVTLLLLLLLAGWNLHTITARADGPAIALIHRITSPVQHLSPLLQATRLDRAWALD